MEISRDSHSPVSPNSEDVAALRARVEELRAPHQEEMEEIKTRLAKRDTWGPVRTKLVAICDFATRGGPETRQAEVGQMVWHFNRALVALEEGNLVPGVECLVRNIEEKVGTAQIAEMGGSESTVVGIPTAGIGSLHAQEALNDFALLTRVAPLTATMLDRSMGRVLTYSATT